MQHTLPLIGEALPPKCVGRLMASAMKAICPTKTMQIATVVDHRNIFPLILATGAAHGDS